MGKQIEVQVQKNVRRENIYWRPNLGTSFFWLGFNFIAHFCLSGVPDCQSALNGLAYSRSKPFSKTLVLESRNILKAQVGNVM